MYIHIGFRAFHGLSIIFSQIFFKVIFNFFFKKKKSIDTYTNLDIRLPIAIQ